MKSPTVQNPLDTLARLAPLDLALPGDPVGMQIKSRRPIRKILVAHDVSLSAARAAVLQKADLIVAYHPLIFRPLEKIDTTSPNHQAITLLAQHRIGVYIVHTALDVADSGINDALADVAGLKETEILDGIGVEPLYKIAVFVPESHTDKVRTAMCSAGAGHIGHYDFCSFALRGQGTFRGLKGTKPFIGQPGKVEFAREDRLEVIVPTGHLDTVLAAMKSVHPYEEVAYDIYRLEISGKTLGIGRIGTLEKPVILSQLAAQVERKLVSKNVRIIGPAGRRVRRVAVFGGSANRYVGKTALAGADVLITGEVNYHEEQEAVERGLSLILVGHAESEKPGWTAFSLKVKKALKGFSIQTIG